MGDSVRVSDFIERSVEDVEVSVVAPCLNEEESIPELARRIMAVFSSKSLRGELVLVDDGSTDRTSEVARELMATYPNLRLERHDKNRGIEAGWRTGVAAARGRLVCLIDADLQNPPDQIWNLYREIVFFNADMVQGSRSSIGRSRDSRFILSRGLNTILNLSFGMNLRDNKSGFVIAQKDVLLDVLRHRFRYYYFQSFIAVSAASKGYSIRQVETPFENRFAGKSFITGMPTKFVVRTLIDVAKGWFEFRFAVKRDHALQDLLKARASAKSDVSIAWWRRCLLDGFLMCGSLLGSPVSRRARLYYEELRQSQWLSTSELRELQEIKLRALVQHAYRHVHYYRDLMDNLKITPEEIVGIDDLVKLPVLNRSDVRNNTYFSLLSDNHNKRRIQEVVGFSDSHQSGAFFVDHHRLEIGWATELRARDWVGDTLINKSGSVVEQKRCGTAEFPGIAYACEVSDKLHLSVESYIVEVLKDGLPAQPGEVGEVVVTDLNNYCMPIIRYRLGKTARVIDGKQSCACGRSLPLIEWINPENAGN